MRSDIFLVNYNVQGSAVADYTLHHSEHDSNK